MNNTSKRTSKQSASLMTVLALGLWLLSPGEATAGGEECPTRVVYAVMPVVAPQWWAYCRVWNPSETSQELLIVRENQDGSETVEYNGSMGPDGKVAFSTPLNTAVGFRFEATASPQGDEAEDGFIIANCMLQANAANQAVAVPINAGLPF